MLVEPPASTSTRQQSSHSGASANQDSPKGDRPRPGLLLLSVAMAAVAFLFSWEKTLTDKKGEWERQGDRQRCCNAGIHIQHAILLGSCMLKVREFSLCFFLWLWRCIMRTSVNKCVIFLWVAHLFWYFTLVYLRLHWKCEYICRKHLSRHTTSTLTSWRAVF